MGAQVVDYRVSTLVVLCKDCGQDVGLYPSRHKCQTNISRPPVPALPTRYMDSNESLQVPRKPVHSPETASSGGSYSRPTSSASSSSFSSMSSPNFSDTTANSTPSPSSGKWARFGQRNKAESQQQDDDESIYFNNFAAHLPEEERQGRKLWGKVRQNEKWKQMTEKNDTPKPTGKLWGKLLMATQNMADRIPSRDDKGPESDESDWEGETHVSRVIREHYEKKRRPLPNWLRDERTPSSSDTASHHQKQYQHTIPSSPSSPDDAAKPSSRRRLWDHSQEPSNRERERQELRQQPPPETHRSPVYRDEYDSYDKPPSTHQSHRSRRGYTDNYDDDDYDRYQQPPTSHRTNARISQGDSRMDQQQGRPRGRDVSPAGRFEQRRHGYENDMEDHHYSGRRAAAPPPSQDRLRGPRNQPSRPNRYLDTTADYF